jgi:macrolide glycosyltransferase
MTTPASHIAFFCIPSSGHFNPTVAVVSELVRRGHRVSYATTADFAPEVAAAGATPVVCTSVLPSTQRGVPWPVGDTVAMSDLYLQEAITSLPEQAAAFEADRPDLIVYDCLSFNAQVLARRMGIPSVRTLPTHEFGPDIWDEMEILNLMLEEEPGWHAYRTAFREFLDAAGIGLGIDEFIYRGHADRYLVTIPREFQKDADRIEDRFTFVGHCIDERRDGEHWEPAADGRPLLLVSMGSALKVDPDFFRLCVEAFGGSPWQVVVVVGGKVDTAAFGDVPANFELHAFVPQLAVLKQAAAFVTHGGMGGTLEGLYQGVPMVVLPQVFDAFGNAALLERLGVAVSFTGEDLTAQKLREAVESLTADPEVAGRLAELKTSMRAAGGSGAAADVIEECLRNTAARR